MTKQGRIPDQTGYGPAMKTPFLLLCIFALTVSPCLAEQGVREWTNQEGKTISAELVELEEGKATLRMTNGRKYTIELSTLSQADQEFARQWQKKQEVAAERGKIETKLGTPTEVVVQSPFDKDAPAMRKGDLAGWKAGIGEWSIADGSLIGNEVPEDNHASSLTHRLEATDMIITAQVQLGDAEQIAFACRDTVPPNLHLGRLYITPDKLWIQHMSGISKTTKAERLITKEVEIDPQKWYDVTIEIIGDTYRAKVGDEELEATHSRFADAKGIVALTNKGQGARFKNVEIWKAEGKQ